MGRIAKSSLCGSRIDIKRAEGSCGGTSRSATGEDIMPEKKTMQRARRAKRQGKAPTTQAGEFVREEFEHAKRGKHKVSSRKQAIAIGLSKARRSGVDLAPPKGRGRTTRKAEQDLERGRSRRGGSRRSGGSSGRSSSRSRSSRSSGGRATGRHTPSRSGRSNRGRSRRRS